MHKTIIALLSFWILSALIQFATYGQAAETTPPSSKSAAQGVIDKKWAIPVTIVTKPIEPSETEREGRERKEHAANESRTTYATIALAFIAFAQAGLFVWQLAYMRAGMRDAAQSAEAAVMQAKVARDTLVNVQRPWVFVYGVKYLQLDAVKMQSTPFVPYTVANFGQTPAIIENISVSFSEEDTYPSAPLRVDDDHKLLVAPIVEPGNILRDLMYIPAEAFIPEDLNTQGGHLVPRIENDMKQLFFTVIIKYRGSFSTKHETSACWVYNRINGFFVHYGHGDYNYEK